VLGTEDIELVDTHVSAVKLTRVRDKDDKQTHIWFAPDHNYELVKISHLDKDGSDYKMVLRGQLTKANESPNEDIDIAHD